MANKDARFLAVTFSSSDISNEGRVLNLAAVQNLCCSFVRSEISEGQVGMFLGCAHELLECELFHFSLCESVF